MKKTLFAILLCGFIVMGLTGASKKIMMMIKNSLMLNLWIVFYND